MIRKARLAFPVLNEPEQFQGEGKPKYSATLIFERDSENHKACLKAMRAAAAAKWGEDKADAAVKGLSKALKVALIDGDTKAEYDGFEGKMAVSAHSQAASPPTLLGAAKEKLPRDTTAIYAGCYVNASVEFWGQDNKWGKRINATIRGVQFAGDGDSFAASAPASSDEFDTVEGAEADEDDFVI